MAEMLTDDRERPLVLNDERLLKRLLSLNEGDELPAEVKDQYWIAKRFADRVSHPMSVDMLIRVCMDAKRQAQPEPEQVWLLKAVKDKQVVAGTNVKVKLGGKERRGLFRNLTQDQQHCRVHLEGDAEERRIEITNVVGVA